MVLYASDRSGREVCECHMYETVVRCAVGVTHGFQLGVWLHRCSALSPILFMLKDRLTDDVRQEAPLTAMFEDDIVICSESREWVGRKPRSLRNEVQQE